MNEIKTEGPALILIVDDEENILSSIKRLLLSEGSFGEENLEVITAASGEKALQVLSDNPDIALIVSDQRMPGLSGVELLEQAKAITPNALRILLTGYADIKASIDAINRGGAYRYITKPWKDDELVQIIKEALERSALIKENKRLAEIVKKQNEELKRWNSQLEYFVQEQTIEIQKKNEELQKVNERLKNNFKSSILAFSNLLELRDTSSGSHSRNVAELTVKIAKAAGLDDEIESITAASLLHDIGKIGIPDIILQKNIDEMESEELEVYKQHPVRGQTAIDLIEDLRNAGLLIRHHHECHNGSGFPDKLYGDKIPIGSRIIAIADFIDRTIRQFDGDNAVELTLRKAKEDLGKKFDHTLYDLIDAPVREMYARNLPQVKMIEMELYPKDLKEGMIVSRDVRSGTGLLLLSRGIKLDEKNIHALRRSYQLDPSKKGVFVLVKR